MAMRSESGTTGHSPRTFIEIARRTQIVECAIQVIAELGYTRASVAEIAKRAEVSKGVISYHFASKDELIEQVVVELYARAGELIGARVENAATAGDALRGYLGANLAFVRENPTNVRVLLEIFVNFRDSDGRPRFGAGDNEELLAHLEQILHWGQESGAFRQFATRPMAMVIRGAVDAASGQVAADPGFDIDSYIAEIITTFELATAGSTA